MTLTECLDERWIDAALHPSDRDAALRRVMEMLHAAGAVHEVEDPLRRLIAREEVMSTGVRPGVALPHTRSVAVPRTVVSICRVPDGVDFKAPDGARTKLVFTLLGPPDSAGDHVKILARIARLLIKDQVRQALLLASTAAEMIRIIRDGERLL